MTLLVKASHLVKVWFYETFPKSWTKEMIYAAMHERFRKLELGDKLEKIEIEKLDD